ncbi:MULTISPECIES: hypothetical protein [Thermomonospora]|uniref:Uncharacterized protein n=1 Tax=Thermomonospora curvata (strain ATCC 19995 / DSM 43183 / JCM 3096 / KCTC 9072 / NBRC 15933 / NCIMB 10081 / Henssen B9) TaxID=471852 RepID=D1ADU0_THECD|nr:MULTISPECIES: hypothetical protein [Thermomonospora]ACY97550.1 conserved hypothetical protein [Thermomonospora curvata DSM 43183]
MPLSLSGLARRATGEFDRLLAALARQGQELLSPGREQRAEIVRLRAALAVQSERAERLERALAEQSAALSAVSRQLAALVAQLNEQLLPGIDERIHETERDLARLATRLLRADQEAARRHSRLETAEQRIADLRERTGRLEQRTAIWRELQADVARLGEDLDALRSCAALQAGEHRAAEQEQA